MKYFASICRAKATHLSPDGRAETGARTGDMIMVRNPSSGQAFQARVTGDDAAVVIPHEIYFGRKARTVKYFASICRLKATSSGQAFQARITGDDAAVVIPHEIYFEGKHAQ